MFNEIFGKLKFGKTLSLVNYFTLLMVNFDIGQSIIMIVLNIIYV